MLLAILPDSDICYFDVQSKTWKQLSLVQKLAKADECYCAEFIGNCLYVAARINTDHVICCYDIVRDIWSTLPPIPGLSAIQIGSLCHIEDHLYVIYNNSSTLYSYNIPKNHWQSAASLKSVCYLGQKTFCNKAAAMYKSCLYVLYGQGKIQRVNNKYGPTFYSEVSLFVLYCFDPKKNVWEQKASTKTPHFGSGLLVENNNLYVAGGSCSFHATCSEPNGCPDGSPAAIEVYNDQENAWSVVKQTHIPTNNHGAVEVDGRVYFIISSFPVDSGVILPPGEVYPALLDEWKNLRKIASNAVLCYVSVKTENLTTK